MSATMAGRRAAPADDTDSPMRTRGSVSRVIAADADRLYHWVADVTRTPEWSPETRGCTWAEGATGAARVGDRFLGTNRSGLLRWARQCEIVTAEPGCEFAFRTIPDAKADDSTLWTFRFEPVEGGTRLTHCYEMLRVLPPRPARLVAFLIPKHRDRTPDMARSLERIADAVEGRTDVPQPRLGQTHTAEGPHRLGGMYAMHHAFRRDLRDLALAVSTTGPAETATWAALARRWTGFATVLHHHHTIEDEQVWPRVLERADAAGDAAARATLEAMSAQHELLDPLVEACAAGFQEMAATPSEAARARLAATLVRCRGLLAEHLAHEETGALPLVQRYLSAASWQASEDAASAEFHLSDFSFTIPWVTHEVPDDQFRFAFGGNHLMMRAVLLFTGRRFARAHRTAFRWL
ncbi:hypothetical protein GCM10022221_27900 [Actinocorallia aurea]